MPTLEAFAPRFIEGYARANRQKPSGIAAKEWILRLHLIPELGSRTLDAISNEQVQRLKLRLRDKSPKTINNVLSVLNVLLKQAVEWGVLDKMPCSIRLVRVPRTDAAFHDFDDYERLLEAAQTIDPRSYLIALLGGEAGLRAGEIVALEWADVDLERRQIRVRHSDWCGELTAPKNGRIRFVGMTERLAAAIPPAAASPQPSRAVQGRRHAAHAAGRLVTCSLCGQAGKGADRRSHPASSCRLPDYAEHAFGGR